MFPHGSCRLELSTQKEAQQLPWHSSSIFKAADFPELSLKECAMFPQFLMGIKCALETSQEFTSSQTREFVENRRAVF